MTSDGRQRSRAPAWDDLRVFAALARCQNLSAAGRALGVDHATVGRRIQRLERRLGLALFDRRAGRYALTEPGARVLVQAAAMEDAARAAEQAGAHPHASPVTVRVTTTELLASRYLALRIANLRAEHPDIVVELLSNDRNLSLSRREADVALRLARPRDGDAIARRLVTIGYGLYAAPGYLDRAGMRPDRHAYIGYEEDRHDVPESAWFDRIAAGRTVALRSNSLAVQLAAAAAGIGVGLLPHYAAREAGLQRLPGPPGLARELWLLVHKSRQTVTPVRRVMDFLIARIGRDSKDFAG